MDISPSNAPDPEELPHYPSFTDDEGLRWVVRQIRAKRATRNGVIEHPAVEVMRMDDSALRKELLLENDATYDDALRWAAFDINAELAVLVKSEHDLNVSEDDEDEPRPAG